MLAIGPVPVPIIRHYGKSQNSAENPSKGRQCEGSIAHSSPTKTDSQGGRKGPMVRSEREEGRMSAFDQPIKAHALCHGCQCYPECRNDCPDSAECYDAMPEYWSKQYRAMKYAEAVRARKPESIGARLRRGKPHKPLAMEYAAMDAGPAEAVWWQRGRVWLIPYSDTPLGAGRAA